MLKQLLTLFLTFDDYVDRYFKENALIDSEDLFTKYDSYILSINDGVIAVLGKDTDAAFHGVTSIKHIFTQVKDNNILNLKINDFHQQYLFYLIYLKHQLHDL